MLTLTRATYVMNKDGEVSPSHAEGSHIPCLVLQDAAENDYLIETTKEVVETVRDILNQIEN